ncbi:unnamed protein product [Symbiodinium necroappetens]|uniref:DUF4116 domain-containing protein n=1 Tax=Symbiodinium necroappetens TaxID=1628268 RepID=A0A812W7A2_9DINO|nr:unnamed protein product [Symbiodinium necroappetens]
MQWLRWTMADGLGLLAASGREGDSSARNGPHDRDPLLQPSDRPVTILTLAAESVGCSLEEEMTLSELKRSIQSQTGHHPSSMQIFVNGELCEKGASPNLKVQTLSVVRCQWDQEKKEAFHAKLEAAVETGQALQFLQYMEHNLEQEKLMRRARRFAQHPHRHRQRTPVLDLSAWLQEDDKFLEDILLLSATTPDEMHARLCEVLLKAGEPQLRPIPGLAARLAKRPELKTWRWLQVLPWLGGNKFFLLNTLASCSRQDCIAIGKHATEEFLADEEFVKALVKKNGLSLRFANLRFKGNPDVVRLAMKENAFAFEYASAELRSDLSMALPAVSHDGLLLQFLPEDLKSNMEVIRTAVSNNVRAVEFARGDATELGQLAATEVLNSLGEETEDPVSALVVHARDVCAKCFDYPRLLHTLQTYLQEADSRSDGQPTRSKQFALEAVKYRPGRYYNELSESDRCDVDIAVEAVRHCPGLFPESLPAQLRYDFEVMVTAIAAASDERQILMYRVPHTAKTRVFREVEHRLGKELEPVV